MSDDNRLKVKVPTKTRKGKWHAKTVQAILLKNGRQFFQSEI